MRPFFVRGTFLVRDTAGPMSCFLYIELWNYFRARGRGRRGWDLLLDGKWLAPWFMRLRIQGRAYACLACQRYGLVESLPAPPFPSDLRTKTAETLARKLRQARGRDFVCYSLVK